MITFKNNRQVGRRVTHLGAVVFVSLAWASAQTPSWLKDITQQKPKTTNAKPAAPATKPSAANQKPAAQPVTRPAGTPSTANQKPSGFPFNTVTRQNTAASGQPNQPAQKSSLLGQVMKASSGSQPAGGSAQSPFAETQRGSRPSGPGGAAPAGPGGGTLSWNSVSYSPEGCAHNGNRVVCAFTYTNQGNAHRMDTYHALSPVEFVDDANNPHRSSARYFMDRYGTRQEAQDVKPGDSGTYVVEFTDIDPRVTGGTFRLDKQEVGGISVMNLDENGQPISSPAASNLPQNAAAPAAPVLQSQPAVRR